MKRNALNSFLLLSLSVVMWLNFTSCNNPYKTQLPQIRISLFSPINDKIEAKVFIEGRDGNIVNGAIVSVKDTSNTITILDYDFQKGCYYKLINKSSSEEYIFTVNSRLFSSPKVYTIPHTCLEDTIDVKNIEMVNKTGESYQNYDSFDTSYPIRITWASAVEGCTYKVTIRTPISVLYEISTNNKTIELPANTIPANTNYVYLQIQQQKSYGDIYFQTDNYYSVSVYSTGNITFNVI